MAKSKIVTLKLSTETLKKFPVENTLNQTKQRRKSSASSKSSNSSAGNQLATPSPVKKEQSTNDLESPSRPVTPTGESKKKGGRASASSGAGRGNAKTAKRSILSSPAPESSPGPSDVNVKSGLGKTVTTGEDVSREENNEKQGLQNGGLVRKWVKKPVDITSFTGYNIEFHSWTGGKRDKPKDDDTNADLKETLVKKEDGTTPKPSGLKVQIKLNNKRLDNDSNVDSRDQSPAFPDEASSIATSPEGSNVATPN
ncbi:Ribonuclease H [Wickerhamomyces ciferrii]|uniref:Ribonuclease H n=1 Tax=Wickerhamomyces ciferrii (strain ATCC 14091 / BCRC 22168 / CBS 111 / JCM 3599 / NBRC 0793 / NRRL Y-1031 F-60-10) TaxID=1206466 RepID=K0KGY9_WICCF|nr:Ribonuclease H [Wickerhamomyces ciferrii]CCH44460.1 Ribonuclease H [Wickerhamomyces ciferrii]